MDSLAWLIKQGDLMPAYTATLRVNEAPVPLDDADSITFLMVGQGTDETVTGEATVVEADTGQVSYEWAAGDTDVVDLYRAEWRVDWGGNRIQTFPNEDYKSIRVVADLG